MTIQNKYLNYPLSLSDKLALYLNWRKMQFDQEKKNFVSQDLKNTNKIERCQRDIIYFY